MGITQPLRPEKTPMWDIAYQRKPFYRRAWFFVPLLLLMAVLIAGGQIGRAHV